MFYVFLFVNSHIRVVIKMVNGEVSENSKHIFLSIMICNKEYNMFVLSPFKRHIQTQIINNNIHLME